ncbi:MAG: hypothetical protein V3S12_01985 [Acidiferrobacterales bacterium]
MNRVTIGLVFCALLLVVSCSNDQESSNTNSARGDHVWKDQVQAYDRARQVEDMLKKAADKRKDSLEQRTQ